jgi:hypothetical protein
MLKEPLVQKIVLFRVVLDPGNKFQIWIRIEIEFEKNWGLNQRSIGIDLGKKPEARNLVLLSF